MRKQSFRAPLTQSDQVLRWRYPNLRMILLQPRRASAQQQRDRALERRLRRPRFRHATAFFWLQMEYLVTKKSGWSRVRAKLVGVGRLTRRRHFPSLIEAPPFLGRFHEWSRFAWHPCRKAGHSWEDVGEREWYCKRCGLELTSKYRPPSHAFITPMPWVLGIDAYLVATRPVP